MNVWCVHVGRKVSRDKQKVRTMWMSVVFTWAITCIEINTKSTKVLVSNRQGTWP